MGALALASPVLDRAARPRTAPGLARDVIGLRFPNPVGLAAGFEPGNPRLRGRMAEGR